MDELTPDTAKLFTAKEERRKKLAALPYPEKARIVVEMQKMVEPIMRSRGRHVRVWQLPSNQS